MLDEESFAGLEQLQVKRRVAAVVLFYAVGCWFYTTMEDWSLVDAAYFITLTITSVGYGDLQPSSLLCRCFTIIYAIIGLAAIFGIVGEFISKYLELIQAQALHDARTSSKTTEEIHREQNIKMALSVFAIIATILGGGVFYSLLEGWTLMDAVYFSSMTTLTVGYGDLSVTSQTARFASIIYMTLSVIVFATAVGNFQAVGLARTLEERRQEMLKKELDLEVLFRLDEDGDGKVTLIEFITGALHQISGIDPDTEIHPWIDRFHELDADGNGYLDQNDLKLINERKIPGIAKSLRLGDEGLSADVENQIDSSQSPLLERKKIYNSYSSL